MPLRYAEAQQASPISEPVTWQAATGIGCNTALTTLMNRQALSSLLHARMTHVPDHTILVGGMMLKQVQFVFCSGSV